MREKFKKLCKERGESTYQVCKEAGIARSTITNWMSKPDSDLSLATIRKLADHFKVPISYFVE